MHFNEQFSLNAKSSNGRKLIKRPTETPGLELTRNNSYTSQIYSPSSNMSYDRNFDKNITQNQNIHDSYSQSGSFNQPNFGEYPQSSVSSVGFAQSRLLNDPLVTNVAMQYGQAIVASGRQIMDKELEKYVAVSRLKYYFAVDTAYVSKKLSIILFPYLHSDWSVKYDQNEPIQPKFEVNAPDLYIPAMAFLTYVLVVGLILGTNSQFSPEKLSIEATNALAWTVLEVVIQLITLYISSIDTNLKTFDLIAYSSYKYVGMIITLLVKLLFGRVGYTFSLLYASASLAFFLMRTLKLQVLADPMAYQQNVYGIPEPPVQQLGLKRRQYFLLFVSCWQALLMWWLTWRIV